MGKSAFGPPIRRPAPAARTTATTRTGPLNHGLRVSCRLRGGRTAPAPRRERDETEASVVAEGLLTGRHRGDLRPRPQDEVPPRRLPQGPRRQDPGDDLPEALHADARLVRGGDVPARRPRPLPRRRRDPAQPGGDGPRYGEGPPAVRARRHDP